MGQIYNLLPSDFVFLFPFFPFFPFLTMSNLHVV